MQVIEVTQYISEKETQTFYVVKDDDNYLIDKDWGHVEMFYTITEANNAVNNPDYVFAEAFAKKADQLYFYEIDNVIGIYDDNLTCLASDDNIYLLMDLVHEGEYDCNKFMIFTFGDYEKDDDNDDGDYSDRDYYDCPPSYYDPRYDGPMHYIPPGER